MKHISTLLAKYKAPHAFYQGHEVTSIINYLASGRIHIVDYTGMDILINREELIII